MVSLSLVPETQPVDIDPETGPRLFVGAASPLWLMFGGAAVAGATWWWWTARWREAVNLEAIMAVAPEPVAPLEPLAEAAAEATKAVAEASAEIADVVVDTARRSNASSQGALDLVPEPETPAPAVEQLLAEPSEPEPAIVAEVVKSLDAAADDLTRVVGIGPKLALALADRGVTRFAQIAAWNADEVSEIDTALNLKGRAIRDAWVAQAKRFTEAAD